MKNTRYIVRPDADEFVIWDTLHNEPQDVNAQFGDEKTAQLEADRLNGKCCTKTWFKAGGRIEAQCDEPAEPDQVCSSCGAARCREHGDLSFDEIGGKVLCEDCASLEGGQQ